MVLEGGVERSSEEQLLGDGVDQSDAEHECYRTGVGLREDGVQGAGDARQVMSDHRRQEERHERRGAERTGGDRDPHRRLRHRTQGYGPGDQGAHDPDGGQHEPQQRERG